MGSTIAVPNQLLKVPDFPADVLKQFDGRPLWKVDEQTHTVYGLSTAELPDCDREVADYNDSVTYYTAWGDETAARTRNAGQEISYGNIRYQHSSQIAGKALRIDPIPEKKQIWLLTQPVDDDIWRQLVQGFLTGYSHAGRYAYRRCFECGYDLPAGNYCPQCHKDVLARYAPILSEVSYVDRPCLPQAVFAYVKADGSTELRKFVAPAAKKVIVDVRDMAKRFCDEFMAAITKAKDEPKCPHCGSTDYGLLPPDFETAKCGECGKNWNHGIVAGVNDSEKVAACFGLSKGTDLAQRYQILPGISADTLRRIAREGLTPELAADPQVKALSAAIQAIKAGITTGTGFNFFQQQGVKRPEKCPHCEHCLGEDVTENKCPGCGKAVIGDTATEKTESAPGKDIETMTAEELQKAIDAGVSAALAKTKVKKEDSIECPFCGAEVDIPDDYDDDEIECPECEEEIPLKAAKALCAAVLAKVIKIAKAVKYLVTESDGTQHLPYTDESGKPDHRLMGAAWAALHDGYRGNKYEGPDKGKAIARLKRIYEQEGMETPKAIAISDLRKKFNTWLEHRCQKDMYSLGNLANILQGIRWLQQSQFFEGQAEQDDQDFELADRIGAWLKDGVDLLGDLFEHEGEELVEPLSGPGAGKVYKFAVPALMAAIHEGDVNAMRVNELVNKAHKGLHKFLGKAAAHHEKMAAMHEKAHEAFGEGDTEKVHKAFHKAAAEHHKAMHEACKAAAEDLGHEEAKADDAAEITKALGESLNSKLEPLAKALKTIEGLEGLTGVVERIGTLEKAIEKLGNETIPTAVKGAGSPQLIDRGGKVIDASQAGSPSGGLFE